MSTASLPVPRRPTTLAVALLALCGASLVAVVTVLGIASGGFATFEGAGDLLVEVGFVFWNLSPALGLAGVVLLVDRRLPLGRLPLVVGAVVFAVFLGVSLVDFLTSDSSTAALLFLFLPLPLWAVVLVTAGVAVLVHERRSRRRVASGASPGHEPR